MPPPFVLAPNDVLVLRFRGRRGIDWGPNWDLDRLKAFSDALSREPAKAVIEVKYRWGRRLRTLIREVPVSVAQHGGYVDQLTNLTNGFTHMPKVKEQAVHFE